MIQYRHFRFNKGAMTLAYRDSSGYIEYSAAFCSKKDQFDKRVGREVSEDRLVSNEYNMVDVFQESDPVLLCLLDMVGSGYYPDCHTKNVKETLAIYLLRSLNAGY